MVPLSVLDLSPIVEGGDAAQALRNTLDLARHAERWGFHRYWLAEHHNMPGIASAATSVVIGHVAGGRTSAPARRHHAADHSPLAIAEQFGTLSRSRADRSGLGARLADGLTARAMRQLALDEPSVSQDVELIAFAPGGPRPSGAGPTCRLILGSSTFGAARCALGLLFSFACIPRPHR